MRIVALVLAAGEGRRAGGPKALLAIEGSTFLARVAGVLARPGIEEVVAVLGHDAERVRREGRLPEAARAVVNPSYAAGMLGSICRGLDAAEARGAEAVLVHPVDHPLVAPDTVDAVVAALEGGAVIAVPSHEGRRGHPAGFARAAWPALRAADPARGARSVLHARPEWVAHVRGDPGCVQGIDTPEDYARLVG
jgi:CTP:molybdopterin cytidylyltransferase MocA